MKKVALHNLGCKVNAYETEAMQELLEKHGYEIVPFQEGADVYIINTCTVTNMADRKSRQMLHKARKMNPDSIVVACGCYVQAKKDDIPEGIDIVVGNNKKQNIVEILENYEKEKNQDGQRETSDEQEKETETYQEILDINHEKAYEDLHLSTAAEHTRAYIKVQDGCNQFCSYCIIPKSRGRVRSKSLDMLKNEIETLSNAGIKEIVLVGINLSAYGKGENFNIVDAVKICNGNDKIKRIRLGSLEPDHLTDEVIDGLAKCEKLCPQFHISLQSGCDKTLKSMNRHYTADEYKALCDKLRSSFENASLTTDIMVGFNDETEHDFNESLDFVKSIAFEKVHVFPYSERVGTAASKRGDNVPKQEKERRAAVMIEETEKIRHDYLKKLVGTNEKVLFENKIEPNLFQGYTKSYLPVRMKYNRNIVGEELEVKIIDYTDEFCIAE